MTGLSQQNIVHTYFGTWNSYTTMKLHALEKGLVVYQMARDNPLHCSEYQDGLNLVHLF